MGDIRVGDFVIININNIDRYGFPSHTYNTILSDNFKIYIITKINEHYDDFPYYIGELECSFKSEEILVLRRLE